MVEYGVTDAGFNKKSWAAIIDSCHNNAKRMFGGDVDLTPGSPIKVMIDLFAFELTSLWNEAEACYNSAFLPTSTGTALDNLGKLIGAIRTPALKADGYVTFFRTTILSSNSPRIIPIGTKVATATIKSVEFVTTESVYFEPIIKDEIHWVETPTYVVYSDNIIHSIQEVRDSNDNIYTDSITFSGRTITFNEQVNEDTTLYITYKPLSVTAPIKAVSVGADSNVAANTVTIMSTPIDFIHYISNENGINSGSDVESDSHFRKKIIGATQSIGKATTNALKYYIGRVTDVKNVLIEDPLRIEIIESLIGNGGKTFFTQHTPLYSVASVIGAIGGTYTIESFDMQSGELNLTTSTINNETLSIKYTYVVPGKIRIYVEGGVTGDEFTQDTIVYAIESTRAAGIQAYGYGTDDPTACGSPTAPFSWFYRPNNALIDLNLAIYFDSKSSLSISDKDQILLEIEDVISDYINSLELQDKIYKNKLIQLAIDVNEDIVDVQLINWKINYVDQDITNTYVIAGNLELYIANNISLTKLVG